MEYLKDLGILTLIIGGTTGGVAIVLKFLLDGFKDQIKLLIETNKETAYKLDEHTKEDVKHFSEIYRLLGEVHGNLGQRHY